MKTILICINISLLVYAKLNEQEILKSRINKMVYGSIEIREQNNKKYIYVHFCDNKKQKAPLCA